MITDHVAILTHAALAEAVPNRKKPTKPLQFYGLFAFPPAAGPDLEAIAKAAAPGGNLAGLSINVKTNRQQTKPIPGVPGDWFIIRASTQFAPYIADAHGTHLDQSRDGGRIRSEFYAGKKVRAALSAYFWPNDGGGISFNLDGVMAVADGERLSIGGGDVVNAFGKYAQPGSNAPATSTQGNPFGAQGGSPAGTPPAQAGGDNPFAQSGGAGGAPNPFA